MSLESKIDELIAALERNTAALAKSLPAGSLAQAAAPAKEPKQTRAQKALEGAVAAQAAQTQQAPAAAQPAAQAPAASPSGLTVKDLVPLVTELMNAGQDGYNAAANIIQVAAGNVKGAKLPQVPPEKYQDVKEQVEAALAKLKNPAPAASPPSLI